MTDSQHISPFHILLSLSYSGWLTGQYHSTAVSQGGNDLSESVSASEKWTVEKIIKNKVRTVPQIVTEAGR